MHAVATHPTKPLYASVGEDAILRFWDLASRDEWKSKGQHFFLFFCLIIFFSKKNDAHKQHVHILFVGDFFRVII